MLKIRNILITGILSLTSLAGVSLSHTELNELRELMRDQDFIPAEVINWRTALFADYASEVAYGDEYDIYSFLNRLGFKLIKNIKFGEKSNLQAFIARKTIFGNKKLILIAIRGTQEIRDFVTDMQALGISNLSKSKISKLLELTMGVGLDSGGVHEGFASMAADLVEQIPDEIFKDSKNTYYLITGHSLGGAVAVLYAFDLSLRLKMNRQEVRNHILVYTFGQPPVAEYKILKEFNSYFNLIRIYNSNDVIANIDLLSEVYKKAGIFFDKTLSFSNNGYDLGRCGFFGHSNTDCYLKKIKDIALMYNKSASWNGNGSILNFQRGGQKTGAGFDYDYSVIHTNTPVRVFNSFQWQIDSTRGKYLKLDYAKGSFKDEKFRVCMGPWNSDVYDKVCFDDVYLPITLNPYEYFSNVQDGDWFVIGMESKSNIEPKNSHLAFIKAEPVNSLKNNDYYGYFATTPTIVDGTHYWSGTGSIINFKAGNEEGFGLSYDIAKVSQKILDGRLKPVVYFQWQYNQQNGGKLEIVSNCIKKATIRLTPWKFAGYRKYNYVYSNVNLPTFIPRDPFDRKKVVDITKLKYDGWRVNNGDWFVVEVKAEEIDPMCVNIEESGDTPYIGAIVSR